MQLRQSLVDELPHHDTFCPPANGDAEGISDDGINDFDHPDFDMPDINYMDEHVDFEAHKVSKFAFLIVSSYASTFFRNREKSGGL